MFLYFPFKPVTLEVKFSSGVENLISCCFSFRFFTATQFEPLRARRAFPCFDEPAMKATFNVTLVHDPNLIALSNMPIYRSQIDDGWKYDHFRKTVKMSTYLAAFAVGDFKYKETKTGSGIQVHILVVFFSNGRGGDHLTISWCTLVPRPKWWSLNSFLAWVRQCVSPADVWMGGVKLLRC